MTTHPGRPRSTPLTPDHLAQCAQVLEHLLPPGYQLVHGRKDGWLLRRWDSFTTRDGPRMGWCPVDSSASLTTLLERLGEP